MLCVRTVGCKRMSARSSAGLSLRSQRGLGTEKDKLHHCQEWKKLKRGPLRNVPKMMTVVGCDKEELSVFLDRP